MLRTILWIIFTGSVFITSGKFVNATNTPKFYLVVVALLVLVIAFSVRLNRINLTSACANKTMLWGIITICFGQACYGLFQFVDWLPSNHSKFAITGSFDNPTGFASVLAIGFPIGLYLLVKVKKVERYLIGTSLVVIAAKSGEF